MNANLPKFMTIKDFCQYSGFSRYQFMHLAYKANVTIKQLGPGHVEDWRSKIVDVQEALAAIEALPEADKEVPVNLNPGRNAVGRDEADETEQMAAGE
jgi:hypothetical protein